MAEWVGNGNGITAGEAVTLAGIISDTDPESVEAFVLCTVCGNGNGGYGMKISSSFQDDPIPVLIVLRDAYTIVRSSVSGENGKGRAT